MWPPGDRLDSRPFVPILGVRSDMPVNTIVESSCTAYAYAHPTPVEALWSAPYDVAGWECYSERDVPTVALALTRLRMAFAGGPAIHVDHRVYGCLGAGFPAQVAV